MQEGRDHKKLFTEIIKRQILVLGPEITLARVRNVPGIVADPSGEVTSLQGDSHELLQNLIDQFVELSGLIVKKTMESILASYPNLASFGPDVGTAAASASGLTQTTQSPPLAPPTSQTDPVSSPVSPTSVPGSSDPQANVPGMSREQIDQLNKMFEEVNKGTS